jgi:hypothetical protein
MTNNGTGTLGWMAIPSAGDPGGTNARVLSLGGHATNVMIESSAATTVPLVISNAIASSSNSFEIVGTNGITGKSVVVTSDGKMGIGTNIPRAVVDIQNGTNDGNGYLLRVGSGNVADGSNVFTVRTNGYAAIGNFGSDSDYADLGIKGRPNARLWMWDTAGNGNSSSIGLGDSSSSGAYAGLTRWSNPTTGGGYGLLVLENDKHNILFSTLAASSRPDFYIASNSLAAFGTNIPTARLQVMASNGVASVVKFGTQTAPSLLDMDTNGLTRIQGGTYYPTNNLPSTLTAASLGVGGYWVGNSNGFLVTIYSLDGSTTAMKVLAP